MSSEFIRLHLNFSCVYSSLANQHVMRQMFITAQSNVLIQRLNLPVCSDFSMFYIAFWHKLSTLPRSIKKETQHVEDNFVTNLLFEVINRKLFNQARVEFKYFFWPNEDFNALNALDSQMFSNEFSVSFQRLMSKPFCL